MKKRIFCFVVVFSVLCSCFTFRWKVAFAGEEDVGVAGMGFLKTRYAARPQGMGSAFVAVADDISALWENVGGLANLSGQEFLFTHLRYLDGIGCNNLGYAIATKYGGIGFGFTMRSFTIEEMGGQYNEKGTMLMKDQVFSVAYSRKFRQLFTYGCGVDLLTSVIGDYSLTAYGINFGGLYFAPKGFVIGFSGKELGPPYAYKTESFTGAKQPLPTAYIIGLSKKLKIPGGGLAVNCDVVKDCVFRVNTGAECVLWKLFSLRVGYKFGYDSAGLTLGMGVEYKPKGLDRLQLDYAFSPTGELGNTHCVSLITKF